MSMLSSPRLTASTLSSSSYVSLLSVSTAIRLVLTSTRLVSPASSSQEDAPPTARLDPAVPLLDRIKTITFHLTTKCLESESTTSTLQQTASGAYDFASISLRTPYRLRTAGHLSALPLEQLTITTPSGPSDAFDLACAHLLPRLDPRRVLHQTDRDPTTRPDVWSIQFRAVDVAYLSSWRSLRQVAWNGTLLHVTLDGGLSHTGPFYRTWSALGANPRTLELKFDFASQLGTYTKKWTAFGLAYRVAFLQDLLSYGGASRAFADRVPLRVTLLVRQEDAAEARKDVDKLEEWSKKLVVVETV